MTHRLATTCTTCWPSWHSQGSLMSPVLLVEDIPPPSVLGTETYLRNLRRWRAGTCPPLAEMACHAPAMDVTNGALPSFYQRPSDPALYHHGLTTKIGCAAGTSQAASTSVAAAPDERCLGRALWKLASSLHWSHQGHHCPPNDGPSGIPS